MSQVQVEEISTLFFFCNNLVIARNFLKNYEYLSTKPMNRHSLWSWKCTQQGHILSHITRPARISSSAFIDGIVYIKKTRMTNREDTLWNEGPVPENCILWPCKYPNNLIKLATSVVHHRTCGLDETVSDLM